MAILMALKEKVSHGMDIPDDPWQFGNDILYGMCRENPLHTNSDVIAGKLWLIGRSYAAALERRKTNDGYNTEGFYKMAIPILQKEIEGKIDEHISRLTVLEKPSDENIGTVLCAHSLLVNVFHMMTNLQKRSLASKYLHFHCPHLFFIYDSRSSSKIKQYIRKDSKRLKRGFVCDACGAHFEPDAEYADFCIRALELQRYVEKEKGRLLTPREIDNLLLYEKQPIEA